MKNKFKKECIYWEESKGLENLEKLIVKGGYKGDFKN